MKDQLEKLIAIEAAMTAELARNTTVKGKAMPHLQDAQTRVRTAISATRRHLAQQGAEEEKSAKGKQPPAAPKP